MMLIAYRRVSELIRFIGHKLIWNKGCFTLFVVKMVYQLIIRNWRGTSRTRQLKRDYLETDYVFMTERKAPITDDTFRKIVARAGEVAKLGLSVHPHMLRHPTGYKITNDGRDTRSIQHYLGHKNIQNTVPYTEISATRFKGFWSDYKSVGNFWVSV